MYDLHDRHFHPGLVEQFIQCMGVYPIGSIVELNTGSVGVVITVNRTRRLRPRVALVLKPDKRPYEQPVYIDLMRQPEQAADRLEVLRCWHRVLTASIRSTICPDGRHDPAPALTGGGRSPRHVPGCALSRGSQ